jgi:hypothetical protein
VLFFDAFQDGIWIFSMKNVSGFGESRNKLSFLSESPWGNGF